MSRFIAILALALLGALAVWIYDFVFDRAPPHRFVVNADREISSAQLVLRDEASVMQISGKKAFGERDVGDASGAITVRFKDGTSSTCRIGYITNGEMEPHEIGISGGACEVPLPSL